jgi:tetratricopeptide (TPR) repeat protein
MKQQTLPNDHMDIGISFNNVGFTYDNLEMYDKALIYYRRALEIYQMCLPKYHIELGILLDNMAIAYRFKNQFKECFEYHHQALDIKEHLNPLNFLTLAQTLHNIGVAYADRTVNNDQQDDVKAFEYFHRSISMHESNKSLQSPDAANTFYEQGRLHERRQEYQSAFDLLIKALTIQQTMLKRNHPATWKTRDALIGLKIEL